MGPGWVDTGGGFPGDSLDGAEGEGLWLTGTLATRSGPFGDPSVAHLQERGTEYNTIMLKWFKKK